MIRKANPYEGVPSLFDMYIQTVARPTTPRRFGAEIFENGTRDLQLIPMDLPAGPDYVVGPGDGLSIDLWGGVSQRLIRTVDRGGQITLPEAGPILVSGKTLESVQQDVQKALRSQYRDVSVGVSLSRLRTIRIYEVGDVTNPGAYDISSLSTPTQCAVCRRRAFHARLDAHSEALSRQPVRADRRRLRPFATWRKNRNRAAGKWRYGSGPSYRPAGNHRRNGAPAGDL